MARESESPARSGAVQGEDGRRCPAGESDDYLTDHAQQSNAVEADQWFWSFFRPGVEPADGQTKATAPYGPSIPDAFLFTVKAPNSLTLTHCVHDGNVDRCTAWSILTACIILLGVVFLARFLGGKWKSMRVIEPQHPAALPVAPAELPTLRSEPFPLVWSPGRRHKGPQLRVPKNAEDAAIDHASRSTK